MRGAFRLKLRLFSAAAVLFALVIVVRLYFVQIVHGEEYSFKAERQYESGSEALYDRGSIYFTRKDGTLMSAATVSTGFRLALNPSRLENPESAYDAITEYAEIDR